MLPRQQLRLDSREALLKGGRSGPAIVPGDPERSLLMSVLNHTHAKIQMPPGSCRRRNWIIAQWIKAGAVFPASTDPCSRSASAKSSARIGRFNL